ncbi:MAG: hypothetical protein K0R68_2477 [Mycobacterium sp.]|nr:hypothetical protein [Mycobacterium sp.]
MRPTVSGFALDGGAFEDGVLTSGAQKPPAVPAEDSAAVRQRCRDGEGRREHHFLLGDEHLSGYGPDPVRAVDVSEVVTQLCW